MSYLNSISNPEQLQIWNAAGTLCFSLPNTETIMCDTNNFHYLIVKRFKEQLDELILNEAELAICKSSHPGKIILKIGEVNILLWWTTFYTIENEILLRENILKYT